MPTAEQHNADRFLYFGYGSNMLTRRLADPSRAPSARALGVGYVEKHRLTFDKISRGTRQNSGKCDMEATGLDADRVYGVLFSIAVEDEASLDREEGLGLQRSPELTQGCSPKVDHIDFPPMTRASRDAHEAALLHLPSVVCAGPPRRPSPARVLGVGVSDRSPRADASLVASA